MESFCETLSCLSRLSQRCGEDVIEQHADSWSVGSKQKACCCKQAQNWESVHETLTCLDGPAGAVGCMQDRIRAEQAVWPQRQLSANHHQLTWVTKAMHAMCTASVAQCSNASHAAAGAMARYQPACAFTCNARLSYVQCCSLIQTKDNLATTRTLSQGKYNVLHMKV
jgi:hypothetical protein